MISEVTAAVLFFLLLAAAWLVLPTLFVHRERVEGAARRERQRQVAAERVHLAGPLPGGPPRMRSRGALAGRLVRNSQDGTSPNGTTPRYFFVADGGAHGPGELRVPIYHQVNPRPDLLRKEIYVAEVAGMRLEAGNLPLLAEMLSVELARLRRGGALPRYWFTLPDGGSVPVFARGEGFEARIPGGPHLVEQTVGRLRRRLAEYLAPFGEAARGGGPEVLVLGADLRCARPVAAFAAGELWLPVLRMDGALVVEEAVYERQPAEEDAAALLPLRRRVADRLVARGRVRSPAEVRIEEVERHAAQRLRLLLGPPVGHLPCFGAEGGTLEQVLLPVFRFQGEVLCPGRADFSVLYVGRDEEELRAQVDGSSWRDGLGAAADLLPPAAAGQARDKTSALGRVI
ncbi:MAG: hypothetical protein QN152_08540 [Armatimonadota bacterium]|nr:hypothetical protein [Armatimonadota bacterium]